MANFSTLDHAQRRLRRLHADFLCPWLNSVHRPENVSFRLYEWIRCLPNTHVVPHRPRPLHPLVPVSLQATAPQVTFPLTPPASSSSSSSFSSSSSSLLHHPSPSFTSSHPSSHPSHHFCRWLLSIAQLRRSLPPSLNSRPTSTLALAPSVAGSTPFLSFGTRSLCRGTRCLLQRRRSLSTSLNSLILQRRRCLPPSIAIDSPTLIAPFNVRALSVDSTASSTLAQRQRTLSFKRAAMATNGKRLLYDAPSSDEEDAEDAAVLYDGDSGTKAAPARRSYFDIKCVLLRRTQHTCAHPP